MLCRSGYVVTETTELKKELTVRPVASNDVPQPSFKVWRRVDGGRMLVPRFFGHDRFGPPPKDARRAPHSCGSLRFVGHLRPETRQTDAFECGVRAFESHGGGVLSLPCGYGKSTMALAFACHLKVRTMIVVHKEFLANQWVEKIKEFCPDSSIGRVQGPVCDIEGHDFVIALIQTLSQKEFPKETFDSIGFLVVDEAHHIGAPAFSQFMFKLCPKWTLGLTATPERKDGLTRLLYWFLGPEFFRVERTAQKSTRVEILQFHHEAFHEAPPVTRFGKINMPAMINQLTEIEERNELILNTARRALEAKRRVLILSDRRDHCFYLQSKLGDSVAGLYVGAMKEDELAISAQKSVVVATFQLAQEGLDIPVLDTVILSTPKSDIKQSIGRIMRETKGKLNTPLIIDIVDAWSVFWSMARKRSVVYHAGGFEVVSEGPKTAPAPVAPAQCLFI